MKGCCSINKKQKITLACFLPVALAALFYAGGYLAQFIYNYQAWTAEGGTPYSGTSPPMPDAAFSVCLQFVFRFPYGLYGMGIFLAAIVLLVVAIMHMGAGGDGQYDKTRNLTYSHKGTYGTAGFLNPKEAGQVLDFVPDLRKHHGTILGEVDGRVVCIPEKTRFNGNLAIYGASGSKKTRAFCVNMILQCAARKSSLVICDPKSELYEKTSAYLRDQGYTVRVFNLVTPASSDSWNCLSEIDGQELMAQLFCDVIIRNTGSDRGDHFWDSAEMNLLKALVLFVERSYPPKRRNIGEAYQLLVSCSEKELNELFDALPLGHPARAPYIIFRQSSESVRGGVIIGLGSRLQVFQNADIRAITSHDEIDLELPGKQPCAYYCITSDQDSTFDFLSSLFLSFIFIKLVRYADQNCPGGCLPVPVHVLGEELCACGVIPDLSRKISVIRSRNISMSCVFQNLAGLQNRYPNNQWQEILGNCDVQLFLGCTDALTAEFISSRSGEASVAVTSQAKQLGTWRISNYTPEYRETSGVGRRRLLTMDEVLRLDVDKALVIIRGRNILEVDKFDYSKHYEAKKLRPDKAAAHIPRWQSEAPPAPDTPAPRMAPAPKKDAPAKKQKIITTSKESILSKPKKEERPMPRKKELPVPDSGEQDDLLSAETQEFPDAPLTEPVAEPIPTESPPDEGAPEDDTPSEEYTEFLQALNEAPAQENPQSAPATEAEQLPSEEEPALAIPSEELPPEPPRADSPPMPHNGAVLTITARTRIKSEAEATDELWHEIRNAYRTRRILTGTLDGIEQTAGGKTLATVSFRGFRIAIPIREMLVLEERMPSGRAYADYMNRLNRILGTMLGAEIDFIVKGIDSTTHSAVASRREAMLRKRQTFYLGKDVSGNPYIYPGRLVEARVIAVAEKVLRVEAFGIECAIFARDLSWQWVSDVRDLYSVGDRVLVRVQEISGEDAEHLSIRADIRSTFSETSVDNLKKCQVQSKYAGKVTDLRGGVVYIRLNNGVNAIAHTCYDSRMPGKKDDVSFAVTRLDEEHGIAVGIITRIIKRNL